MIILNRNAVLAYSLIKFLSKQPVGSKVRLGTGLSLFRFGLFFEIGNNFLRA